VADHTSRDEGGGYRHLQTYLEASARGCKLQEDGMLEPSSPAAKQLVCFLQDHVGVLDRTDAKRYAARMVRLGVDEVRELLDKVAMKDGHRARLLVHVRRGSAHRLAWACDSLTHSFGPRGGVPACLRSCLGLSRRAVQLKRSMEESAADEEGNGPRDASGAGTKSGRRDRARAASV